MSAGRSIKSFSTRLIDWQQQHGRHDLPWQNTRDAYRIWLAEIMLQQTQVSTVIPYYLRFVERFASVQTLAQAPLATVLECWAGLGYYARARNLLRCAQVVDADYHGEFPNDLESLNALPGIGRSTAAAIGVFAYGKRAAILDGNVKRVLARCFGIEGLPGSAKTERALWSLADSLLPKMQIEAYTQGLMDLGSTVCTRHKPQCSACPVHVLCIACREGRQTELPVAKAARTLPERETALLLLTDGRRVLLERRPPAGIWGGLLTLPEGSASEAGDFARRRGCRLLATQNLPVLKHSFSHFRLTIHTLQCRVQPTSCLVAEGGWQWLEQEEIEMAALPTPIRRLLRTLRESKLQAPE